ncbi:hypothetical protein [Aureibacter tunicatorum]|uniref:Uncharacterized protein n=1 Tax=Aureibacter tunicatorum TaxID=866807 RepID=A0AAE3XL30_9BACT|nr:hypothetical protein [Aureibacter tunicatorum]MDR6237900.1 hypothetical protein [Aureibacter tunicatorum]BDD02933.1 hypothetical protein AUTU_04160 [Aureibacter tunicatorum]
MNSDLINERFNIINETLSIINPSGKQIAFNQENLGCIIKFDFIPQDTGKYILNNVRRISLKEGVRELRNYAPSQLIEDQIIIEFK